MRGPYSIHLLLFKKSFDTVCRHQTATDQLPSVAVPRHSDRALGRVRTADPPVGGVDIRLLQHEGWRQLPVSLLLPHRLHAVRHARGYHVQED